MNDLYSRQTPYSVEAEQAVLGSVLIDPKSAPRVIELLSADDFYIETNRLIFETISHMFTAAKIIDPVTVLDEMKALGYKEQANRDYFLQLIETTPSAANVEEYAAIVRGKSMLRELQTAAGEILELTRSEQDDPQDIAELAEQKIYAIRQGREISGLTSIKAAIRLVYDHLDEMAAHPGKLTGFGTLHPDSPDIEGDVNHLLELGLKGVKLHPDIQQFKIDDYRCLRIYDLCEGRLPILMHTGDSRFDYSNPNRLLPVLEIYKNLTVIGAHFGGYSVWDEAESRLVGLPNLYVDCSSTRFAVSDEKVVELIRAYGSDRVLFGTDYPMWSPVEETAWFLGLPLTEEERRRILYENVCNLLSIPVPAPVERQ